MEHEPQLHVYFFEALSVAAKALVTVLATANDSGSKKNCHHCNAVIFENGFHTFTREATLFLVAQSEVAAVRALHFLFPLPDSTASWSDDEVFYLG